MNSNIQIISFIVSFIYGVIFYFVTNINVYLIKDLKLYLKHILTFIYTLDMAIIYIIILYHLNKGYFHIYFIMGYIIDKKLSKLSVKKT